MFRDVGLLSIYNICTGLHRRISSEILDMAQYFLPVEFDKYIVFIRIFYRFPFKYLPVLAFLYQFSYGPGHRGHNMKYAYGHSSLEIDLQYFTKQVPLLTFLSPTLNQILFSTTPPCHDASMLTC